MDETLLLPGYRFIPNDKELYVDYLYPKITGQLSPVLQRIVPDCDLYGTEEPWMVWKRFGGDELGGLGDLYFFTKLKKTNPRSSRVERSVGKGTWHGENTGVPLLLEEIGQTGMKRRFCYRSKTLSKQQQEGHFIMHEYSFPNIKSNLVLCSLRKKDAFSVSSPGSKKRKLEKGLKIVWLWRRGWKIHPRRENLMKKGLLLIVLLSMNQWDLICVYPWTN
ncbi:NAC domain-containing protein 67 [Jatropha curcas]|uniref:NAC domain-containing protein 67 n=1 Tax=Jatropha curcas TaxID=180498 RepID=UPI001892EF46|nr:NAC domain-containing protein 67 [Jatropha curcas]